MFSWWTKEMAWGKQKPDEMGTAWCIFRKQHTASLALFSVQFPNLEEAENTAATNDPEITEKQTIWIC